MEKRCKKCGAVLQEESIFCGMCGMRVEEESVVKEEAAAEEESVAEEEVTAEEGAVPKEEIYLFHPIKMARRLSEKYTVEGQEKRKKYLRFFLVLFEIVLFGGNIVACGDDVYTGRELMRQTLNVRFNGWEEWGKAVVLLLFLVYAYVLIRTFMVKERGFQKHIRLVWNVNILLLITFAFYGLTDYFELKSGSFVCLAISIAVNGLMLYGTAYEIQNGWEPMPGKIHDWFVSKEAVLSLSFFGTILCIAMYMKCSDQDLKMIFWVPVAVKIFSAVISCWKKEKSYQLMRLQSCVDLLCCVVVFLFYQTYSHSTKYLLDSGLMLAMGVVSPFGLNYLWKRQGGKVEIKGTHKKLFRLAILAVAVVCMVNFVSAAKTAHERQARQELLDKFTSSYADGIWDLEGIDGNLVIYHKEGFSDPDFQCGIDGRLMTGILYRASSSLRSSEYDFGLIIKEKVDAQSYLVNISYMMADGEWETCEDVKMTKIDTEEIGLYISQSISDQARTDMGGVFVPMGNEIWCGEEHNAFDSIDSNYNLNYILDKNDGVFRGRSNLQYTKNGAMLYAPATYAFYEVNPALEFRCVSRYSDTEYGY